ncbi:unnamed protein product [Arabidopsis thaliana]|nr:unnamed protein product [Arabidopsis thaliana]
MASSLQSSGMLTKEQMVYLFDRFDYLTSQSDVKKRISDAVDDKQEAVAVTTAIQEEIFLEMGIDPGFGIGCLGKLNSAYENDKELMIGFYKFLAKEEMACEEAELGQDGFEQKMKALQQLQEQQLEMLKYMRKFSLDDQSAILQKVNKNKNKTLQKQLENAGFEPEASLLSGEEMEEAGRRRVSPYPLSSRSMGNHQADKKFAWVIKNFNSLDTTRVYSDTFKAGRCKWRLVAYPKRRDRYTTSFSLFLCVPDSESLPSGWRRRAKFIEYSSSRSMGNHQADKKFTWVIKNYNSLGSGSVYSDTFKAGRCKWRLLAFPKGNNIYDYFFLYICVPNSESLPSGWRRRAKVSFTMVNQIPGGLSQQREAVYWFDEKDTTHEEPERIDINGFQVPASQVESMNSLFEKYRGFASKIFPKNQHLRKTFLDVVLSMTEILCKSPEELSSGDLAEAYSALRFVTKAGFKLDWLEKKLKETGKSRLQEIEEDLKDLKKEEWIDREMPDWGPVFVAVTLFVLLTPGLLIQVPGRGRVVEFGTFQTSGLSVIVHTLIYFTLVCILLLALQIHMYIG